ncbi:Dyp-type peroxidase, partial [Nocardia sp. NPDC004722]
TEQEKVIGRTKLDDYELPEDEQPANSHVAVNDQDVSGNIVRANMPFGSVQDGEFGTYYIAYADDPAVIETMLTRMFLGSTEAAYDRILDFSTAITGTSFFTPPAGFFDALPDAPAPAAVAVRESPGANGVVSGNGSLGIGTLRNR